MKKWFLLLFFSILIGVLLGLFEDSKSLEPFRSSLLTIVFAITTFSVTFSMGAFNASAYRQFHLTFPPRLLWSSVALLFIAFIPLIILVSCPSIYIPTSLFLLPTLVVLGAYLQEIGRQETDPIVLLDRLCSLPILERHLRVLVPKIDAKINETDVLELSRVSDRPMHESDWHLPVPTQRDDPMTNLITLGLLAIKQDDLHAFGSVIRRSLEASELVRKFSPQKTVNASYKIRKTLSDRMYGDLQRLVLGLQHNKSTVSLASVTINILAEFIVAKTKERQQTDDVVFSWMKLIETLSKHCYESGSRLEIRVPIIIARQIVQKGMDDPPKAPEEGDKPIEILEFHWCLPNLTNFIMNLGSFAIEKGDTEFLYRCLDAFGWLGCSAVKHRNMKVASACLRALTQLGREVRVKKLECFWDKCPVRPEDHAVERMDWMTTWIRQIPEDQRQEIIGLLECAYSRFYGKEIELKLVKRQDGEVLIEKGTNGKKYIEEYLMNAGDRLADYSDFTFLKNIELKPYKGGLIQGPVIPITS